MSSQPAFAIESLEGFELTADGQYLMLKSNQPDRIALHCSVMHELLAAVANAIGWSERIRSKKKSVKFAMPCEAWEIGKDSGGSPNLVVTFRLPGGAELSFRMNSSQAAQMTEVLAVTTGLATASTAGTTLQ
jgi:hypothetical protein